MTTDRKKGRIFAAFVLACGLMGGVQQLAQASALQMSESTGEAVQASAVTSETEETAQESTTDTASAAGETQSADTKQQDTVADGQILSGVHIGEVDVSGMTAAEASAAVEQYVDEKKSYLMTLDIGDTKITATTGDVGLYWGNTDVVNQAVTLGKEGNAVQRFKIKKQLDKGSYTFDLDYALADEAAKSFLEERCVPECDKDPQEPTFDMSGGSLTVVDGQNGCTLKVDESVDAIRSYLTDGWDGGAGTITMVYDVTEPSHTTDELSSVKDILGKASTDYSKSSKSRSTNISTAAKLINGTVLYPGDTFSTLDTITPFSEENGYALAGSYANGTTTETFGGGICQVSTTLYLAVLRAELEVTERKNHSMLVNYVKPSMDAAIAESSGKDFKFKNNTDHPVYIYMVAYNGTLAARVYGAEYRDSNRKVTYESVTLSTEEATTTIKTSSAYNVGVINRTQSAHQGCSAELYKVVTVNGKEESRERVNTSHYAKSDGLIEVGTAGASSAVASELAKAAATGDLSQVKAVLASIGK